jgi:hypothetical protein
MSQALPLDLRKLRAKRELKGLSLAATTDNALMAVHYRSETVVTHEIRARADDAIRSFAI